MQHLETCFTSTAEAHRVLCQLVMFLTVFFHWMYKTKYSCYQVCYSMLVCSLVFLVERCVACQSWKSDFGWHRFRFSPCLMRIKEDSKFSSDSRVT